MVSETVYSTTTTCDYCGKYIETKTGDVEKQEYAHSLGWGNRTGMNYFGLSDDMCPDCKASYNEWKKTRKK